MMKRRKKRIPGLTGRKGNVVSYMLNGEYVERTIGVITKAPTKLQLIGRSKMAIANDLLKPVREFIEIGFSMQKKDPFDNCHNLAKSHIMLRAIGGEYPHLEVDFSKVLFSEGNIPPNPEAQVRVVENGLEFCWDQELMIRGMSANDQVMMLAYCPEKESAFYQIAGSRRDTGKDFLEVAAYNQPVTLEVYLCFVAANRKSISNSVYIGHRKF
jgi:hypothetical protein